METNIRSGWRTCGIIPLDVTPLLAKLSKMQSEAICNELVGSSFVNYFEKKAEEANAAAQARPKPKRSKLVSIPGKSKSLEEYLEEQAALEAEQVANKEAKEREIASKKAAAEKAREEKAKLAQEAKEEKARKAQEARDLKAKAAAEAKEKRAAAKEKRAEAAALTKQAKEEEKAKKARKLEAKKVAAQQARELRRAAALDAKAAERQQAAGMLCCANDINQWIYQMSINYLSTSCVGQLHFSGF